jgi:hypothetical protein
VTGIEELELLDDDDEDVDVHVGGKVDELTADMSRS